jgi:hypothetical protein
MTINWGKEVLDNDSAVYTTDNPDSPARELVVTSNNARTDIYVSFNQTSTTYTSALQFLISIQNLINPEISINTDILASDAIIICNVATFQLYCIYNHFGVSFELQHYTDNQTIRLFSILLYMNFLTNNRQTAANAPLTLPRRVFGVDPAFVAQERIAISETEQSLPDPAPRPMIFSNNNPRGNTQLNGQDSENTMATIPHISLKRSENILRETLNFAAPDYDLNAPKTTDHDSGNSPRDKYFANYANYLPQENFLMAKLCLELTMLQAKYIASGILIKDAEQQYTIAVDDQKLFNDYRLYLANDLRDSSGHLIELEIASLDRARLIEKAFNTAVAVRALNPSSKISRYVSNDPERVTHVDLPGHGLRNITALLYEAINHTGLLCTYVTRQDALEALISGIAEGYRGDNRNKTTIRDTNGVDDFLEDNPSCGKGNYNALLSAFIGVLKDVSMIDSVVEEFLSFAKEMVLQHIVGATTKLSTAKQYLNFWLAGISGKVHEPDPSKKPLHPYNKMKRQLLEQEKTISQQFVFAKFDFVEYSTKQTLIRIVKTEAHRLSNSLGSSILESVSPTPEQLEQVFMQQARTSVSPSIWNGFGCLPFNIFSRPRF